MTLGQNESHAALRQILIACGPTIESKLIELFDAPPLYPTAPGFSPVGRFAVSVEIAEDLNLPRLADEMAERLDNNLDDIVWQTYDPDDLVRLTKAAHGSKFENLAAIGQPLLDATIEWATGDTFDWDNALAAEQILEELGMLAPASQLERVRDSVRSAAQYEIEKIMDGTCTRSASDVGTMMESLGLADDCDEDDIFYPHYLAAARYVQRQDRADDISVEPGEKPSTNQSENVEIARLFAALAGGNDDS